MKEMKVDVHHLARVEGHGNIVIDVEEGVLKRCELQIVEAPRFFEAMLRGRSYQEAAHITCRICGICSVGHTNASLRATEDAFGFIPSRQTMLLRRAIMHGEVIQSHILHVYFLAAPDFFGAPSVIPLVGSHPEVVQRALRLKKLANDVCAVIGGRHIHPLSLVPGGFTSFPSEKQIRNLRDRFIEARKDMEATVELFSTISMPSFERRTEYLALRREGEYTFLGGEGDAIVSSYGEAYATRDYKEKVREYPVPHSTAKHVHGGLDAYMVGALARYEINHDYLHPAAQAAAEALGLRPGMFNTFNNNLAQIVECVHCVEDFIGICDELLDRGIVPEPIEIRPRAGRGVGVVEVPRGILFHEYTYDDDGRIVRANCVIPTGQNLHHMERDMEAYVPKALALNDEAEATKHFEMLIRAYDPCISCSTHLLQVSFRDRNGVRSYGAPQ
ncbi:MAG: Ni/Fe hydrogenase subunit alpha [Candidatus Hydrogenedentota bacterium]|nr:MAG: Ni/Fe hydrogenase subunit alpha [Candidatus Hydrogenedentota bacterium]